MQARSCFQCPDFVTRFCASSTRSILNLVTLYLFLGDMWLVHRVAHPLHHFVAFLYGVGYLDDFVFDTLLQRAQGLGDVEAFAFLRRLDDSLSERNKTFFQGLSLLW